MRKLILTLLIGFCYSFADAQTFSIKGQIQNPIDSIVHLRITPHIGEPISKELVLNRNNEFKTSFSLSDIAYLSIFHSTANRSCNLKNVIIEPGEDIVINFDAENFTNSLNFDGYASEKFKYHIENQQINLNQKSKEDINKELALRIELLEKYKNKLSTIYYKIQKADIIGQVNKAKLSLVSNDETLLLAEIKQQIDNLPPQDDTTARTQFFFQYFTDIKYRLYQDSLLKSSSVVSLNRKSFISQNEKIFHPAFAEKLSGENIYRILEQELNGNDIKVFIQQFEDLYPESQYLTLFKKWNVDDFMGKQAPLFEISDLYGKTIKLGNLRGKVVYLDFWGSWCAPCILEMEPIKKVKEYFKNEKDIVFLYVGVDMMENNLKKVIEKEAITGLHGIIDPTKSTTVQRDYRVQSFPSHFVIDRNGVIVTSKPPSPRKSKDLIALLEQTLQK